MLPAIQSSLSGIRAFGKKLDVHADNIANADTDGFKKSRAVLSTDENSGVRADIEKVDTPGPPNPAAAKDATAEKERSNVDLVAEITETIPTTIGYKANLKTIQAEDEMLGALLDAIG